MYASDYTDKHLLWQKRDDRKVERREKGNRGRGNIICDVVYCQHWWELGVCMCECHLLRQRWICPEIIHDLDEGERRRTKERKGEKRRGKYCASGQVKKKRSGTITDKKRRRDETGEEGGEEERCGVKREEKRKGGKGRESSLRMVT